MGETSLQAAKPILMETDEEREKEHSCCQLFPVTVQRGRSVFY